MLQRLAKLIPDRLLKRHGRWNSESAKDGYVKDSVESRLSGGSKGGQGGNRPSFCSAAILFSTRSVDNLM